MKSPYITVISLNLAIASYLIDFSYQQLLSLGVAIVACTFLVLDSDV